MAMDITFLGTVSGAPSSQRNVSSLVLRVPDGTGWMFDCGEGTQQQIIKSVIKPGKMDAIFITHLHGDHLYGLPGLLCTMSNQRPQDRPPMQIFGPVGLKSYIRFNLNIAQAFLGMKYVCHELAEAGEVVPDTVPIHADEIPSQPIYPIEGTRVWKIMETKDFVVHAAPIEHRIPCFGYVIQEASTPGKFDVDAAKAKGVKPGPNFAKLKSGQDITLDDGTVISAAELVGPPIPGRKIVILGDTCQTDAIVATAMDADVVVHEATHDDDLAEKAVECGHSTPAMAGTFAKTVKSKMLILNHFSGRYRDDTKPVPEGEAAPAESAAAAADPAPLVSQIVQHAKVAFGNDNVVAAYDFLTVLIPKRK